MLSVKRSLFHLNFRRSMTLAEHSRRSLSIEDMPHPRSFPLVGTKLNFFLNGSGKRLHEYVDRRHKQLGPIFYESVGGGPELVFISDPVLMKSLFMNLEGKYPMHILPRPWILYEELYGSKRGLLFMNGEEWLNYRRIMNKHLLREGADQWIEGSVNETVSKFIKKWEIKATEGDFIPDLESDFYRLSTDVIIKILMGTESSLIASKHYEELLLRFSETVKTIFQTTTKLYDLPVNLYQRLNLNAWKEFKESVDSSLFLAQKIVLEMLNRRHESNGLIGKLCKENISDEMITRIAADFVIAAGDTTAYTTLWILYLLSKNDDVKFEVRNRQDDYVKHVIKESMRLYPVAPFLARILIQDDTLGPYRLSKGTPIIASIYTSGYDNQNFTRADEFLPYRWDRNDPRRKDLTNHVPSATLPFAMGARSCVGKKIAMVLLTQIIKQVVNKFDIKCLNTTEVNAMTSQVLVPDKHIKLLISVRNNE